MCVLIELYMNVCVFTFQITLQKHTHTHTMIGTKSRQSAHETSRYKRVWISTWGW